MTIEASHTQGAVRGRVRARTKQVPPQLDAIRPLLAGAHARGMVDALDLAGVAAVLIDQQGMVLHAGQPARRLFGPILSMNADHLVGLDGDATRAIQQLISEGLADGPEPVALRLDRREGGALVLRAHRMPGASEDMYQLLKLLIIIENQSL